MMPFMYYDSTYILVLIGMMLSMWAGANVKSTFKKYSSVISASGLTGAMAANLILKRNGINNVEIRGIRGHLTDCYVPSKKILNLSESTIDSRSIAAIGVAAHECGHAIQDARGYSPLVLSRAIIPMCSISSKISMPLIFIGILFSISPAINIGIVLFMVAISFQIITLPVEFNASRRAVESLRAYNVMSEDELMAVKKVLTAAALTYVAAAASSILQLLRLILIAGRNRRDD